MWNKEKNQMKNHMKKALLALSVLSLSACNNDKTFDQMEWHTTAEKFSHYDNFHFAKGSHQLSKGDRAKLHQLLAKADKNTPVYAVISVNLSAHQGKQGVHHARIQALIKCLINHGVASHRIDVVYKNPSELASRKPGDCNRVSVTINQYVLKAPECPGWNEPMNVATDVMGELNFGCNKERNFAAMVAEPQDVYESQKLDPANGSLQSLRVQDYQLGNQRDMISPSSKSDGSSSLSKAPDIRETSIIGKNIGSATK